MESLMLLENPYRRRRKHMRRNPLTVKSGLKEWTQGVDAMEAVAAIGGFAVSALLPSKVVKLSTGTNAFTTNQKLMKLVVGVGGAVATGYLAKSMMGSAAGKAAVLGGLAGAGADYIVNFSKFTIGAPVGMLRGAPMGGRLGAYTPPDEGKQLV